MLNKIDKKSVFSRVGMKMAVLVQLQNDGIVVHPKWMFGTSRASWNDGKSDLEGLLPGNGRDEHFGSKLVFPGGGQLRK